MRDHHGFSLLELMVVLLIVGLGISTAALQLQRDEQAQLRVEARDFAVQIEQVAEEALLTGNAWGLQLYRQRGEDGEEQLVWRWLTLRRRGWEAAAPRTLAVEGRFASGARGALEVEGESIAIRSAAVREPAAVPDCWLAPGEVSPFALRLGLPEQAGGVTVAIDALARVSVREDGEP